MSIPRTTQGELQSTLGTAGLTGLARTAWAAYTAAPTQYRSVFDNMIAKRKGSNEGNFAWTSSGKKWVRDHGSLYVLSY
jgi:hypothetical protein